MSIATIALATCGDTEPHRPGVFPLQPTASNPAPPRPHLGVSREEIYLALDLVDVGFMPLNRHTDDWVNTRLPNGDIWVDIFGPQSTVQAVEIWVRYSASLDDALSALGAVIRETVTLEHREAVYQFFRSGLAARMSDTYPSKGGQTIGREYHVWMEAIPDKQQVFMSIDAEQRR